LLAFLCCGIIFFSGYLKTSEINDTVVAVGRGIDIEGEEILYSAQLAKPETPQRKGTGAKQEPALVVTSRGESFALGARHIYYSTPRKPLWSMIDTIIIGENLARQDTSLFADYLARNRNVRLNANLFLAYQCTPKDVFETEVPLEKLSAPALNKMIELQESQLGIYLPVKAKEFLFKAGTTGIEPVLPQIVIEKTDDKELLKIDGTAVFYNKKMVGSLNEEESRGFRFLSPRRIYGGILIVPSPLEGGLPLTIELTDSLAQTKVEAGDKLKVRINIKAEGSFYEQNDTLDYLTPENIAKVELAASEQIKKEVQACINKAQGFKSDIFGWGRRLSLNEPEVWEKFADDWPEIFAEAETEISVDFKLRRGYLVERVFKPSN